MQKFKRMKLMNFDLKLFELTSSNSNLLDEYFQMEGFYMLEITLIISIATFVNKPWKFTLN